MAGAVAPRNHGKIYATTDQVNDALTASNEAKAAGQPCFGKLALNGASGKRVEVSGAAAYNGSCRSEGARP